MKFYIFRKKVLGAAMGATLSFLGINAGATDTYEDESAEIEPEDGDFYEESDVEERNEELSAGGIVAPEAIVESADNRTEIEKTLDHADEQDSGRGLEFFWMSGNIGYQYMSLAGISNASLLPAGDSSQGGGAAFGGGAGIRLIYFTGGVAMRSAALGSFNLWSLVAELGLRVPLGMFEPYGTFSAGYIGVGDVETKTISKSIGGIHGMNLQLAAGLDFYLSDTFSIGTRWGGDLLFLSRKADASLCEGEPDCVFAQDGSSLGGGTVVSFLVGLHL